MCDTASLSNGIKHAFLSPPDAAAAVLRAAAGRSAVVCCADTPPVVLSLKLESNPAVDGPEHTDDGRQSVYDILIVINCH